MADHGIIRLDKLNALYNGPIVSAQSVSDVDNGNLIIIDGLLSGSSEIFVAATPSAVGDEVLLVASPELQGELYTPGKTLKDFYNEANKPFRAFYLREGDIFTITSDAYDGTAVAGQYMITQAGSFKPIVAAAVGSSKFKARIIEVTTFGYTGSGWNKKTAAVCQVIGV